VDAQGEEIIDAELVEDGELERAAPAPRLLVNLSTSTTGRTCSWLPG
jgi:hypothetical protein